MNELPITIIKAMHKWEQALASAWENDGREERYVASRSKRLHDAADAAKKSLEKVILESLTRPDFSPMRVDEV